MIEFKQPALVGELRRRIAEGVYSGTLPTTLELAAEFGVNPKTMNKAIARLVADGLLERRRRSGTRVCSPLPGDGRLIEVIFEGFTTIFTHPFWGDIWSGMVEQLAADGFRPVLNMLEADPGSGVLDLAHFSMSPAAGRIVLGIADPELLRQVRSSGIPFITACDPLEEPSIPQVTFDFDEGIRQAVELFFRNGCRRIAFIGQTRTLQPLQSPRKFLAYQQAVQTYCGAFDPLLVENARPLTGQGAPALAAVLDRTRPNALLAAYDHQLPELAALLAERKLDLPVIGCDGLHLPGLPDARHVVAAPRLECGKRVAEQLVAAIRERREPVSMSIPAVFR